MQRLLDNAKDCNASPRRSQLPSNFDWAAIGPFDVIAGDHLDDYEGVPVKRGEQAAALSSFDFYTEEPQRSGWIGEHESRLGTMEQIWQCLASIVMEAADLPREESRTAMSYVYRILARLHHTDFIPNEVYKYAPTKEPGVLNRPPAMQILSSHIMNVLTDAAWQAKEAETDLAASAEASKVASSGYKMRVRELGHGIWLDFILWCCTEGGFVKEGTWILKQMAERPEWTVKSWDSVGLPAGLIHSSSVDRDHLWGESVKFPNKESSQSEDAFQGLGERTICSEVVFAVMEGLVDTSNVGVGHRGNSPGYVHDSIAILKSILERNGISVSPNYLTTVIIRIIEAGGVIPEVDPQALDRVLDLAPPVSPDQPESIFPFSAERRIQHPSLEPTNYSSVILGLYQYTLDVYSFLGNVGGAFDTFKKILAYVDAAKLQCSRRFAGELKELVRSSAEEARSRLLDLEKPDFDHIDESSVPQLPNSSLALLLEIATSSKAYAFGEWLLYSTDADGPVIPHTLYGDPVLASSIIRFATATKNQDLFDTVTARLEVPLSNNVLKSILSYNISLHDWDSVTNLLAHLRDEKDGHWGVSNLTCLAAVIIELGARPYSPEQQRVLSKARGILVQLLEGRFNREQNPANAPYTYQEEVLYQLHRMFLSVPGALSNTCQNVRLEWTPSGRDTVRNVSAISFRILLAAVVEHYGSVEGKRLWELWCTEPQSPEDQRVLPGGTSLLYFSHELSWVPFLDEKWAENRRLKAVVPDLRTIRIIAQAAAIEYRKQQAEKARGEMATDATDGENNNKNNDNVVVGNTKESPEDVLLWCVEVFRKFRVRESYINAEVDGYLVEWKRRGMKKSAQVETKPTTAKATTAEAKPEKLDTSETHPEKQTAPPPAD